MLLPLLMNNLLSEAGEPPVIVADPVVDKGQDAGGGAWWEGEWIIPGVTHYLPEKPAEDITPLRPKVEKARKRLQEVRPPEVDPEYQALSRRLTKLLQAAKRLETRAERVTRAQATEAAIQGVVARYRELAERQAAAEAQIRAYEEAAALAAQEEAERQARIAADDELALQLINEALSEIDEKRSRRQRLWQILQPFN